MRIAVIDLGTNTFNLVLAEVKPDNTFAIIYSDKQPARIGKGGINQQIITPEAINRAVSVLKNYVDVINTKGGAGRIVAIATAAVRVAKNKDEFVAAIKEQTGIEVKVISGDEEASLIYEGIKQTIDVGGEIVLTMDIGGGSNEMSIVDGDHIYWKHSFPLGATKMLEMFNPENPIELVTLKKIERYFDEQLALLWNAVSGYNIKTLIGSSGSFDTYRSLLTGGNTGKELTFDIAIADYFKLHERLIKSTAEERSAMPGMVPMRVEMIVLASIFTNLVVRKLKIEHIIQSDYSLREGVLKLVSENKL